MDIYLGVDGTGPGDEDDYTTEFENSFVNRFFKEWHTTLRVYNRGPTTAGTETLGLARTTASLAEGFYNDGMAAFRTEGTTCTTPPRLFLSGYSRGGAAVIDAAYHLGEKGIPVHALMLFDAVDRSGVGHTDVISGNVVNCFHALRDPEAGSREMFGNCGRRSHPSVFYTEQTFYGTHGAIGGAPWKKEGRSGKIEEMSLGQKILAKYLGGIFLWDSVDEEDFTNVTLEQENRAVEEVWDWMHCNFLRARASQASPAVQSFSVPGHRGY